MKRNRHLTKILKIIICILTLSNSFLGVKIGMLLTEQKDYVEIYAEVVGVRHYVEDMEKEEWILKQTDYQVKERETSKIETDIKVFEDNGKGKLKKYEILISYELDNTFYQGVVFKTVYWISSRYQIGNVIKIGVNGGNYADYRDIYSEINRNILILIIDILLEIVLIYKYYQLFRLSTKTEIEDS